MNNSNVDENQVVYQKIKEMEQRQLEKFFLLKVLFTIPYVFYTLLTNHPALNCWKILYFYFVMEHVSESAENFGNHVFQERTVKTFDGFKS